MSREIDPSRFPRPLQELAAKVEAGERLDEADATLCFETPHILHLGRLADHVRRKMHGDTCLAEFRQKEMLPYHRGRGR